MSLHDVSPGLVPGTILDYVERTSNYTAGAESDFIVGNQLPFPLSGSQAVTVSLYLATVSIPSTGGILFRLYDNGSAYERVWDTRNMPTGQAAGGFSLRVIPSAGFHTFKITAALVGTGTVTVQAAAAGGGTSSYAPSSYTVAAG